MILPIIKAGAPVLKQIADPVPRVNKKIRLLLDSMAETMYASDGCGLAAPQVNESIRVIVLDDGNGLLELINPVIIWKEGCVKGVEGCLSVPGYYGEVERADRIKVEAIDRNNKKLSFVTEGFKSRIIQHEIDHLDGILFIEKTNSLQRIEAEKNR